MISFKAKVCLFFFSSLIVGCSTIHTISPYYLLTDDSKSITLYLHDGRVVRFLSGEYKIVKSDSASYINGAGSVLIKNNKNLENFFGKVYFHEIKEMKIIEPPPVWQSTSLTVIGLYVIVLIVFLLTFKVSNI